MVRASAVFLERETEDEALFLNPVGTELLTENNLRLGSEAGLDLTVGRRIDCCDGFEFRWLNVNEWKGYPLDSTVYHILWLGFRFPAYHRSISCWANLHSLLKQSKEQLATRAGRSTIKSKRKLVQVIVKVLSAHGALMCTEQPSFQQRGNTVHAWQELARRNFVLLTKQDCRAVSVAKRRKSCVRWATIGVNHTAFLGRFLHETKQRGARRCRNRCHANATDTGSVFLRGNHHK